MPNFLRLRRRQGVVGRSGQPALMAGAASFSGANYLGAPSSASLQVSAQSFSSAFWYNLAVAPGAFAALYNKGGQTTVTDNWGIQITNANALSSFVSDGVAYSSQTLTALVTGSWQFIYWGWDQTNLWFVNQVNGGSIVTGSAQTHAPQATASAFQIGIGGDRATRGLVGLLDDIIFWDRLLTQAEVTSLWAGGMGIKAKNISGTLKTSVAFGYDLDGPFGDGFWHDAIDANPLTNTGNVAAVMGIN